MAAPKAVLGMQRRRASTVTLTVLHSPRLQVSFISAYSTAICIKFEGKNYAFSDRSRVWLPLMTSPYIDFVIPLRSIAHTGDYAQAPSWPSQIL